MKIKQTILYLLILLSLIGCDRKATNENLVTCSTTDNALYTALGTPEGCK